MKVFRIFLFIILTLVGLTLMKMGSQSINVHIGKEFVVQVSYKTIIGILAYCASFIIWQKLLVENNLSFIVPLTTGIAQISIVIIGSVVFNEQISVYKIIGIILILTGISLISIKKQEVTL